MKRLPRVVRRLLGIRSPSAEWFGTPPDWRAALQPPRPETFRTEADARAFVFPEADRLLAMQDSINRTHDNLEAIRMGALGPAIRVSTPGATSALDAINEATPSAMEAGQRLRTALTNVMSPDNAQPENQSGEPNMTEAMPDTTDPRPPKAPRPDGASISVHVQEDPMRDLVWVLPMGDVRGIGRVYAWSDPTEAGHLSAEVPGLITWRQPYDGPAAPPVGAPGPGLALPEQVALTMARALLAHFGEPSPTEAEVEALREELVTVGRERDEARHEAIVNGVERTQWEVLALEKDATMERMTLAWGTLSDWHDESRKRLEQAETPPMWITGQETLDPVPFAGAMWTTGESGSEEDVPLARRLLVQRNEARDLVEDQRLRLVSVEQELEAVRDQRDQAEAVATQRGEALDAMERRPVVTPDWWIDRHGDAWREEPEGMWVHDLLETRTLDDLHQFYGPLTPAVSCVLTEAPSPEVEKPVEEPAVYTEGSGGISSEVAPMVQGHRWWTAPRKDLGVGRLLWEYDMGTLAAAPVWRVVAYVEDRDNSLMGAEFVIHPGKAVTPEALTNFAAGLPR